jgi:hypothetical protein
MKDRRKEFVNTIKEAMNLNGELQLLSKTLKLERLFEIIMEEVDERIGDRMEEHWENNHRDNSNY